MCQVRLGNYEGTTEVTFEIVDPDPQPTTLSDSMFEVDTHWEIYDGVPITKSIKGMYGDKTLVEGVYTGAVNWAVREGIVTGNPHDDGTYTFDASDSITFEQMVTIVARYVLGGVEAAADYPDDALDNGSFTDADAVDGYARGAFGWAIDNKVVTGNDNGDGTWTLAPLEDVARERVATVLWRTINSGLL